VTCLVGKNESGKTALLKALHKLRPEKPEETFQPARDYPRRKWRPDAEVPESPPAISTTWELSDDEHLALEERFGKGSLPSKEFTLSKGYDNQLRWKITVNEKATVQHLVAEAGVIDEELKPVSEAKTVDDVRKGLHALASPSEAQKKLLELVNAEYGSGVEEAVHKALDRLTPTFLYFDQYLRLDGEVSVDALLARKKAGTLTDNDRVFEALVGLAGTTVEQLHQLPTFEEFNAALRAVSNQITEMIFKYWTQNRHLDVELRLDQARPKDPAPLDKGFVFRTRIVNRRHRADTSFSDRSSGFVWFFSFLVWFYRLRETANRKLVILLDEPGLSLHARAQHDLLRYIREQLKPEYQVVYTTHSPFMVDPDDVLSARTVEDVVRKEKATGEEVLLGTKVGEEVFSTDPDTISPLQRALGYEMTQTLFVGRHTVLVEGSSDWLYLKWFSRQLERAGEPGLDYRWAISIVGGVDRVPGFVSLYRGSELQVAALVDVQHSLKQRIDNARKALRDGHLLTVDKYAGQAEADIEDVLGREFYLALVWRTYDLPASSALPSTRPAQAPPRVAMEVAERFRTMPPGVPEFDHKTPAEYVFRQGDEGAKLPGFEAALKRMKSLIADLNTLLLK
jgi:ABC-type hemin transport system ATPase subunit